MYISEELLQIFIVHLPIFFQLLLLKLLYSWIAAKIFLSRNSIWPHSILPPRDLIFFILLWFLAWTGENLSILSSLLCSRLLKNREYFFYSLKISVIYRSSALYLHFKLKACSDDRQEGLPSFGHFFHFTCSLYQFCSTCNTTEILPFFVFYTTSTYFPLWVFPRACGLFWYCFSFPVLHPVCT